MTRRGKIIVVAAALVAGIGAFLSAFGGGGAPVACKRQPLARWLQLSSRDAKAVEDADAGFSEDAAALSEQLRRERETLAEMLDAPDTPDDQVLQQVEAAIAAHNALERRVARYVLAVRATLSPQQQKRLMGLCANGVRRACGRRRRGAGGGRGRHAGRGGGGRGAGLTTGPQD